MSSWLLLAFLCCSTIFNNVPPLEARLHKNASSAVVVGAVFCDTCFPHDFSTNARSLSGALVEVLCKDQSSNRTFLRQVKTNDNGEFSVRLPFSVAKHVRRIKRCSVKLLSSNEPFCSIASTATSSSLKLKSRKQGTPIFSAGFFTFKPQTQPTFCNQKPSSLNTDRFPPFPPPLQDPAEGSYFLPPLPPLPPLPQLPPLPGIPFLPPSAGTPAIPLLPPPVQNVPTNPPVKASESEEEARPDFFRPSVPNPFQLPPLFPPLLPPNPLLPPPAPLLPLPPIPGLTPPPPPPVIPSLPPFGPLPPLPPFPFPPSTPRGPGGPPASTSHKASP